MVDYSEQGKLLNTSRHDALSQKVGATISVMRFPTGMMKYDIEGAHKSFDIMERFTREDPRFAPSFTMFEGFSTHAVRAVPAESTAIGFRDEGVFV